MGFLGGGCLDSGTDVSQPTCSKTFFAPHVPCLVFCEAMTPDVQMGAAQPGQTRTCTIQDCNSRSCGEKPTGAFGINPAEEFEETTERVNVRHAFKGGCLCIPNECHNTRAHVLVQGCLLRHCKIAPYPEAAPSEPTPSLERSRCKSDAPAVPGYLCRLSAWY